MVSLIRRRRELMQAAKQGLDTSPIVVRYGGLHQKTGEFVENAKYYDVTDFYRKPEQKIMVSTFGKYLAGSSSIAIITFYDENKNFLTYNSFTLSTNGSEAKKDFNAPNGARGVYFRTILGRDHADDSYVYVVSTGEIIFAGRNTQYFGKKNIND